MNNAIHLLPADGWPRLLFDALWQSTLLAGVGWLVARYCIRQAASRSWLLLLVLSACVIAPLASLFARDQGWGVLKTVDQQSALVLDQAQSIGEHPYQAALDQSEVTTEDTKPPVTAAQPSGAISDGRADDQSATRPNLAATDRVATFPANQHFSVSVTWSSVTANVFKWLGITWLVASCMLVLRFIVGAVATARLLLQAQSCNQIDIQSAASTAAARFGLRRVPRVLITSRIQTPMVWAIGRPRLLVPAAEFINHRQINWTTVFTHELAHVARGDCWARLWIELITIALPLQPLVWVLRRLFRIACEEASDDLAVACGTDPVDLADALTTWIDAHRHSAVLAAIGMSSSKARAMRLLALRAAPVARLNSVWRWVGICAALVLIAGLAVAQATDGNHRSVDSADQRKVASETESKALNTVPPDQPNKALAEDPLIALYTRRIQDDTPPLEETQAELDAIKSGKRQASQQELQNLENSLKTQRGWIEKYRAKLERRTAELNSRLQQTPQDSAESAHTKPEAPGASPYIIGPPDVLEITPVRLVSLEPIKIQPGDKLQIDVQGTKLEEPIHGIFKVDSSGEVVLGPSYGSVRISGLTRSEAQEAVKTQLEAVLASPQVALTIDESRVESGIAGKHLVGPDGSINLGIYGIVRVDGQNIEEASKSIEGQLSQWFANPLVSVDVASFNSKVFYVIVSTEPVIAFHPEPSGDNISRLPIIGHETVLDAIAQVPGLTGLSEAKIWIDRPIAGGHAVIPVNWNYALSGAKPAANPQILPGDRIFVTGARLQAGLPGGESYQAPSARIDSNSSADPKEAQTFDLDFGPPVVVKTVPEAGASDVDPDLAEITVSFSREMRDQSWSWCHTTLESFPKDTGQPKYLSDKRTCVMPVKLEPGKTYNIWFNWPKDEGGYVPRNFKDEHGNSAAPYLLVFKTKDAAPEKN